MFTMHLMALLCALLLAAVSQAAPLNSKAGVGKKTKAVELECLAAHNKWRRLHGASDLVFDKKIASFAQKRADFIAASDGAEFRHPNDLVYGENLAWHSRPTTSCADLIKMWYDEVDLYDFRSGGFSHETGHFTQLVWRNTERVGCAKTVSSGARGGVYLVCNYDPPGNFVGENSDNVLRRLPAPAVTPTSSTTTTSTTTTSTSTSTTTTSTTTTKRPSAGNAPKSNNKSNKKNKNKSKNKKKNGNKKKGNKSKGKKKSKGNKNKNKNKKVTGTNKPSELEKIAQSGQNFSLPLNSSAKPAASG